MSEHTPGPWVARRWYVPTPGSSQGYKLIQECFICDADGRKLAEVFAPEVLEIMAASEQMLEALEKITRAIDGDLGPHRRSAEYVRNVAIEAIAKAKGEQP